MSTVELRPYQSDILDRSAKAEEREVRKQLWVAATGLGKTIVFSELLRRRGERGLILAHRDELISQSVAKVMDADDELRPTVMAEAALLSIGRRDLAQRRSGTRTVGIVKAEANDLSADVVVASVQTLRPARLAQLGRGDAFDTVIVDEAHHSRADTYQRILEELEAGEPDGPLLVGVTATPDRGDGKGLDTIFDEVVANYDMLWGIENGYLSDLRAREVKLVGFDEKSLKVRGGDYTAGSSGAALEAAHAPELIVQAWQREAQGRKTLVFLPTVATAEATKDAFVRAGIRAGWVSGETPADERKELLRDFRSGKVQVVVNCAVLTEGYDEPSIDCIVMARPTKSRALYAQMVGRGCRRFPLKVDCLVLDMVGNSEQHSLVTLPSLFGVEHNPKARKGDITVGEADAEQRTVAARLGGSRDATLFRPLPVSQIAWVVADDASGVQRYVRPLGSKVVNGTPHFLPTVVLAPADDGQWTVSLLFDDGKVRVLMAGTTLELAQGIGEDYIRKNAAVQAFTDSSAAWRSRQPTEKQIAAAAKWRMHVDRKWNAGQLADALTAHITRSKFRKAERLANKQGARQ